jgi:hypothetical protein
MELVNWLNTGNMDLKGFTCRIGSRVGPVYPLFMVLIVLWTPLRSGFMLASLSRHVTLSVCPVLSRIVLRQEGPSREPILCLLSRDMSRADSFSRN